MCCRAAISITAAALLLVLQSCGDIAVPVSEVTARNAASSAGIDRADRDALDKGDLHLIRERYNAVSRAALPIERLSLLCDIFLKYSEIALATECLDDYEIRIQRGEGARDVTVVRRMLAGKRALIALTVGKPEVAQSLLANATDMGSKYVLGLAGSRLGRGEEVLAVAKELSLQLRPKSMFYAANLYAALGDPQMALDVLNNRNANVLRDFGIIGTKNAFGSNVSAVPFRLDVFDEFTFGWFSNVSIAPAANVYVEYLAARCLLDLHRDDEARRRYDAILAFPFIEAYRDVYWRALYDRAQISMHDGDEATALHLLQDSVEIIESVRGSVSTEEGRIVFVDDKQAVYEALVDLLIRDDQPELALEYVERSRSRALVDLLSARKQFGVSPEAAALVAALDQAESELSLTASLNVTDIRSRIQSVETAHDRLLALAPDLAPLVTVQPAKLDEVRAKLRPDEAAIIFFQSGTTWWAFVLQAEKVTVHQLSTTGLANQVLLFNRALGVPGPSNALPIARGLYRELMEQPLKDVTAKRLIVVPTGILHHVAMAALHDGARYLVEKYAMSVVPSLSTLLLPKHPAGGSAGLVIGNPSKDDPEEDRLVGAEVEARAIAALAPGSTLLIGAEATAAEFRRKATGHRFIHFAGHGRFDQANPLNSSIVFAPAIGSSKLLTAAELYSMHLDVDLAVLSGCSTGLGQITTGDDILGLIRGFLYAGPTTVIASLWNIDDRRTVELMELFYRGYLGGQDPADALRAAQLELISEKAEPFYWAAFFLTSIDA
jgi:CHAT domain-containing protein